MDVLKGLFFSLFFIFLYVKKFENIYKKVCTYKLYVLSLHQRKKQTKKIQLWQSLNKSQREISLKK